MNTGNPKLVLKVLEVLEDHNIMEIELRQTINEMEKWISRQPFTWKNEFPLV